MSDAKPPQKNMWLNDGRFLFSLTMASAIANSMEWRFGPGLVYLDMLTNGLARPIDHGGAPLRNSRDGTASGEEYLSSSSSDEEEGSNGTAGAHLSKRASQKQRPNHVRITPRGQFRVDHRNNVDGPTSTANPVVVAAPERGKDNLMDWTPVPCSAVGVKVDDTKKMTSLTGFDYKTTPVNVFSIQDEEGEVFALRTFTNSYNFSLELAFFLGLPLTNSTKWLIPPLCMTYAHAKILHGSVKHTSDHRLVHSKTKGLTDRAIPAMMYPALRRYTDADSAAVVLRAIHDLSKDQLYFDRLPIPMVISSTEYPFEYKAGAIVMLGYDRIYRHTDVTCAMDALNSLLESWRRSLPQSSAESVRVRAYSFGLSDQVVDSIISSL